MYKLLLCSVIPDDDPGRRSLLSSPNALFVAVVMSRSTDFPEACDVATLFVRANTLSVGSWMLASTHAKLLNLRPVGGKCTYGGCRRFIQGENRYCRKIVEHIDNNSSTDLEDEDEVVRHVGGCSSHPLSCWRVDIEITDGSATMAARMWQATAYVVGGGHSPMFGKEFDALPADAQESVLQRSVGGYFWFGLRVLKSQEGRLKWNILKAAKTQQLLIQSSPPAVAFPSTPPSGIKPISLCERFQQHCSKCSSLLRSSSQSAIGDSSSSQPRVLVEDSQRRQPLFSDLALNDHACSACCSNTVDISSQNLKHSDSLHTRVSQKSVRDDIAIASLELSLRQLDASRNLLISELNRLRQNKL